MRLIQIKSVERKQYTGKVYDITVDIDHSYNINGIIVHNSGCTTRTKTGVGVPQVTALIDVLGAATVPVIADGGCRYAGDIAKALAIGADSVMVGSMFAGTVESPGNVFVTGNWPNEKRYKMYRGSASATIKLETRGSAEHVEGTSAMIPLKGYVKDVVNTIQDGIRSAMSYVGATNLEEFRTHAQFVKVTNAGIREAAPHILG